MKKRLAIAAFVASACVTMYPVDFNQVRAQYEGKQVMLRNFYCGKKLEFDAQGKLLSGGASGP